MRIGDTVKVVNNQAEVLVGKTGVILKPGDDFDWLVEMTDIPHHPKVIVPILSVDLVAI